jgi:Transglutaminase-like superfamily
MDTTTSDVIAFLWEPIDSRLIPYGRVGNCPMKAKTMRRAYLLEAALVLAMTRLALYFLPSAWVFAWADRTPRRIRRFRSGESDWVSWAVETAGASRWMNARCLSRALAAQSMLRRRGITSRLCLGVVRRDNALIAHAWVEVGREVILGGAEARRFRKIAEFGRGDGITRAPVA